MDMGSEQSPRSWYCSPLVVQGTVAKWPAGTRMMMMMMLMLIMMKMMMMMVLMMAMMMMI
eukprot:11956779-Karenia_brevis.AAC.1